MRLDDTFGVRRAVAQVYLEFTYAQFIPRFAKLHAAILARCVLTVIVQGIAIGPAKKEEAGNPSGREVSSPDERGNEGGGRRKINQNVEHVLPDGRPSWVLYCCQSYCLGGEMTR